MKTVIDMLGAIQKIRKDYVKTSEFKPFTVKTIEEIENLLSFHLYVYGVNHRENEVLNAIYEKLKDLLEVYDKNTTDYRILSYLNGCAYIYED